MYITYSPSPDRPSSDPIANQRNQRANVNATDGAALQQWAQGIREQMLSQLRGQYPHATALELSQMLQVVGATIASPVATSKRERTPLTVAPVTAEQLGIVQSAPEVSAASFLPTTEGFSNVAPMVMPSPAAASYQPGQSIPTGEREVRQ